MTHRKLHARVFVVVAVAAFCGAEVGAIQTLAEDAIPLVCPLALDEELLELQEAELQVQLNRSSFAAFEEIYQLIAELSERDAIDRMSYLRARYDRDAAKLSLERSDLLLLRQQALIEQLRLACENGSGASGDVESRDQKRAYLQYRRADCDQQAKAIEVAETNLAFNRQWLASVLDLRDQVSTRQDVILAELEVNLEEQRRDDAMKRTKVCRAALRKLEATPIPSQ